ncbi:TPA: trypsin-like peptidase domain-containing protein [Candidatus Scatousia excrementigallinarum]|uniref:Trypsin-like peptidase domain-containing protein n=1 Tax=Candidatus Scatousia excrementigallinarum TaxID=2840935 RepID=A0A9D1EX87_9BACT|nr:trypsin-like peptidase domain-containing protein [Candidatus Scatousia excrementigallinarum]
MFKRIFLIIIMAAGLNWYTAIPVFSVNYAADEQINISVYEAINPAIVSIEAQLDDGVSAGTGCIVSTDGLILTGSHVVDGGESIEVKTSGGQLYKAKIVSKMGKNNDLALLKIEPKQPLKTIKFGDSEKIKVGQKVLAIGNPFGFAGTLTQGIISRIDYSKNKIQTDAAINPGCSGGPLLNTSGEVIGINQSIYNPDNNISNIGIGFAIPINDAKKFIQVAKLTKK